MKEHARNNVPVLHPGFSSVEWACFFAHADAELSRGHTLRAHPTACRYI